MSVFVSTVTKDYVPSPNDNVMDSLFKQYERVIVESIITSFGLDMFIKDKYGGDVDTIHNVRLIGEDPKMEYKSEANRQAYQHHEETDKYNKRIKSQYDSDPNFKKVNAKVSQERKDGTLKDAYTGKTVQRNADMELDHVISTKEIHEDRGRILSGIDGRDLANSEENLKATDHSINESMKDKSIDEYIEWLDRTAEKRNSRIKELKEKDKLSDKEKAELHKLEKQNEVDAEKMKEADRQARKAYEAKLAKAYYTSPQFWSDTAKAAGKKAAAMGARQAVGFIFTEVWFSVRTEFEQVSQPFSLSKALKSIAEGVKKGFERAKAKYKDLIQKYCDGALAGALSSLTTTLCNIFFKTAENVGRIIRQSYASLVQAAKVLFINPENLPFGERMRATAKILATGASVVVGTLVSEALSDCGIGKIPVLGEVISAFCGSMVAGIMTCTLLYFLDRSEFSNKLVSVLNSLPSASKDVAYFTRQAELFEIYAAQLMQIDLQKFEDETAAYQNLVENISPAMTEEELNKELRKTIKAIGIPLPWQGDFNAFMSDKTKRLVFE